MAHLRQCETCGQETCVRHAECEVIELEDLVFRIKQHPDVIKQFPKELADEIRQTHAASKEEVLKEKREEADREMQQEMWKMRLDHHIEKAAREFEEKNPQPNPMRF